MARFNTHIVANPFHTSIRMVISQHLSYQHKKSAIDLVSVHCQCVYMFLRAAGLSSMSQSSAASAERIDLYSIKHLYT